MKPGRKILLALGVGACVYGAAVGIKAGVEAFKLSSMFSVKHVELKGVSKADRKQLDQVCRMFIGMSIFEEIDVRSLPVKDEWIDKIEIKRELPHTLVINVYEEKPLLVYRSEKGCYYYTANGQFFPASCSLVEVELADNADAYTLKQFARIKEQVPELEGRQVRLEQSRFVAQMDGFVLYGSYAGEDFAHNFSVFSDAVKGRYSKIDYADLTAPGKIYVKGDENVS